jgi:DNA-binding MarR family transcriptional regulator
MGAFGKEIHSLIKVLEALQGDHTGTMTMENVSVFLAIAQRPGITSAELSESVGLVQSSISRNTTTLSKWQGIGRPGFDYVEAVADPHERRRKIYYLTIKGRQRLSRALEAMTGGPVALDVPTAKDALATIYR